MARDSMKNNCLLSTYYGQGTVHKFFLSFFPIANIQEFSSIANLLYFLLQAGKDLWLYTILKLSFYQLIFSAEHTVGT